MNESEQNTTSELTKALLLSGIISCSLTLQTHGGKPLSEVPMCVAFDDNPADCVQSDGLGAYCDSEYDVHAYSVGGFAFSTKDQDRIGPRQFRLSFNDPIAVYLPALMPANGTYEGLLYLNSENNAEGTTTGTSIPTGVLQMASGAEKAMCVLIDVRVGVAYYPRYTLEFGRASQNETGPRTPLLLTALADEDNDGRADSWRLESAPISSGEEAWAYVPTTTEAGKKLKMELVGIFRMPFGLGFAKE
jgi:hypothetical protein